jgi:hypothetical protein
MYLPAIKPIIHSTSLLSLIAKITPLFEKSARERTWLRIRRGVWALHSPNLTPCDFFACESLKDKGYETNPHILEE